MKPISKRERVVKMIFTAVLHQHIKLWLICCGRIEIVDDYQRVGFKAPKKSVVLFETRGAVIGRQVAHKDNILDQRLQAAGIAEIQGICVLLLYVLA